MDLINQTPVPPLPPTPEAYPESPEVNSTVGGDSSGTGWEQRTPAEQRAVLGVPTQAELDAELAGKADLVGGLVPANQLPDVAPISCTNAQRLAGTGPVDGIRAGQVVKVTDQGNRIERYQGGGVGDNANWLILAQTYEVRVTNTTGGALTYNGVAVANGATSFAVGLWAAAGAVIPTADDAETNFGTARVGDLAIPMQALAGCTIPNLGQSRATIDLVF